MCGGPVLRLRNQVAREDIERSSSSNGVVKVSTLGRGEFRKALSRTNGVDEGFKDLDT